METNSVIEKFFSREYESCINEKMLMYSYEFPTEEILQYVSEINSIPIDVYLEMAKKYGDGDLITAKDVFQFSNFNSATVKICEVIKKENNPGVSLFEAGKLLLQDGVERKKTAYIKYGENQLKSAEILGLLFEMAHTYFLSCLGYIINDLDQNAQKQLLLRCLLRSKLISKLFAATHNGDVDLRQFLYMLSESTYNRRISNLLHIFQIMNDFNEYDFSQYFSKIKR